MPNPASLGQGPQINCGLIGVGVVGSAVLDFFAEGPLHLRLSTSNKVQSDIPIHIWSASRRNKTNPTAASEELIREVLKNAGGSEQRFFYDSDGSSSFKPGAPAWREIVNDPNVDIVVELTGSPVAEAIIQEALWNGKCVVTANKAVISRTGYDLIKLAQSRGTVLAYEAAVGGGMPIVQMIGTSVGGRITGIQAILNGTTNFILSTMREATEDKARDPAEIYPSALCAATHAGLAESDPSADVLGEDARSKLIILSGLAFGIRLRPKDIYVRGIARKGRRTIPKHLTRAAFHSCSDSKSPCDYICARDDHLSTESIFTTSDLETLESLGYVPKLLAGAQRHLIDGQERIVAWVQPCALLKDHPLSSVSGSQNACLMQAESPSAGSAPHAYEIMVQGPGAGGPETSSSVIADIEFCARQLAIAGKIGTHATSEVPSPTYMYGASALDHAQQYTGSPALALANDLATKYLLRFVLGNGAEPHAATSALINTLNNAGVAIEETLSTEGNSPSIYLQTAPVSMESLEQALEETLNTKANLNLAPNILYLPIMIGAKIPMVSS
ncbi:hypothetical protein M1O29_01425 [Dehalococcoidia bacterium]|nr:hypothetical protein [Dehalococcoidia bacterium]